MMWKEEEREGEWRAKAKREEKPGDERNCLIEWKGSWMNKRFVAKP